MPIYFSGMDVKITLRSGQIIKRPKDEIENFDPLLEIDNLLWPTFIHTF